MEALAFIEEAVTLPTFLITGHACICPLYGACSPGYHKPPLFTIPNDVYLLNWVTPGETFVCQLKSTQRDIIKSQDELKQYLYHHSVSDIQPGHTATTSLFSNLRRATGGVDARGAPIKYPNVQFDLSPDPKIRSSHTKMGLFRIDHGFTSLDPGPAEGGVWSLADLIQRALSQEGVTKGVFFLIGCAEGCVTIPEQQLRRLERYIEDAHNFYTAQRPVLTKEEMDAKGLSEFILTDIPLSKPVTYISLEEILKNENLWDPEGFLLENVRPRDRNKFLAHLRTRRAQKAIPGKWIAKTRKQLIEQQQSRSGTKSRKQLLTRLKDEGKRLPAWASWWLGTQKR